MTRNESIREIKGYIRNEFRFRDEADELLKPVLDDLFVLDTLGKMLSFTGYSDGICLNLEEKKLSIKEKAALFNWLISKKIKDDPRLKGTVSAKVSKTVGIKEMPKQ